VPPRFLTDLRRWALLSVLIGSLSLSACGGSDRVREADADVLYRQAKHALDTNDFKNAIAYYEALDARYPFSDAARQARLDLMYAYYKSGQAESAVDAADQFIRENPTHARVDYAYYIKGLVYFERSPNFLERWFNVDLSERPPSDARQSFAAFQTIVQQYPKSPYAHDARRRMIFLRNRLADYEVYVARYYTKRGAYVGAAARAKFAIENYDGAPAVREALEIMTDAYYRLGLNELAEQTAMVYKANFPETAERVEKKKSWWKFW
jgi:outer membrane protein assembly factor BamD